MPREFHSNPRFQESKPRFNSPIISLLILVVTALTFVGCDAATIVHDVSQRQALTIIAELQRGGIISSAQQDDASPTKFDIVVSSADYREAAALLVRRGLPKKEEISVDELLAPQGFIPSSRDIEALRADRVISLQIETALNGIPGVAFTQAIVRAKSASSVDQGAVSIVVTLDTGVAIGRAELLPIVERMVPGVASDKLALSLFFAEPRRVTSGGESNSPRRYGLNGEQNLVPFLWFTRIPEEEYESLAITLIACICAVALAGAVVGYWFAAAGLGYDSAVDTKNSENEGGNLPAIAPKSGLLARFKRGS